MTGKSTRLSYPRGIGIACTALLCILIAAIAIVIPQRGAQAATQATNSAQVTVNAGQSLGTLTNLSKGLNTAVWDGHLLDSASIAAVKNADVHVLRYPGGSTSDVYNWETNSPGTANPVNTFDAFMGATQSAGIQPIITTNYGTGTAQEAAAWVQYANKGGPGYNGVVPSYPGASPTGHNYGIKYWEVGNEIYGNGTYTAKWEADNHPLGPTTYANNVVAYSQAMKAVDPSIKVGVVLTAPGNWPDGVTSSFSPQPWNNTVLPLTCSSIDFVIAHWYPQNPGGETDAGLLAAPGQIASMVSTLRSELTQFCGSRASAIQIMVTETNSVSSNPGKQTVSLVNALYMDDNYMSWLENGVANVDWWTLHNGLVSGSNTSSSLFGTAQYGDYGVLATGGCASATSNICEPAANTPLPAYYGLQMLSHLGTVGDTMVSSSSNQSLVAVHAVKQANGDLAVLLDNKDPNNSYTVSLGLNGYSASPNATVFTYGQNSTAITSAPGSASSVTVAPYSLTTVVLQPGSGVTPTPAPTNTPVPSPSPTHTPTPTNTPTSGTCKVTYTASQWSTGFTGSLVITNTGTAPINGWTLTFTFPGTQQVVQGWNAVFSQQGNTVTVKDAGYNATIAAGTSANPGFNGSWTGSNPSPTAFTLNGSACSVG